MSYQACINGITMKRLKNTQNKQQISLNHHFKDKQKHPTQQQSRFQSLSKHEDHYKFNLSLDVKNYMLSNNHAGSIKRNNQKNNLDQSFQSKRRNSLLIPKHSKKKINQIQPSFNQIRVIYGTSVKNQKNNLLNFYSQKSIKQKKKRFSLSGKISGQTTGQMYIKQHRQSNHQISDLQKQSIITKSQKIKQLLKTEKYSQAIFYLKQVIPFIDEKSKKKQLYFWLLASMFKVNNVKNQILQGYIIDCLQEFPYFYEAYIIWGRLKMQQNDHQGAIEVFQKAIKLNQTSEQAYIELSTLYLQENMIKQSYQILKQGFKKVIRSSQIPIKILENYKKFHLSITNNKSIQPFLQRIVQSSGRQSTDFFYIQGYIQKQRQNINEALIYFLESLKFNSNKVNATKSLESVICIHIEKRDFYAAYHQAKRTKHLGIDFKKIQKYQLFLEGVNYIMKKQYQQGIKLLVNLQNGFNKNCKSFFSTKNLVKLKNSSRNSLSADIVSLIVKYLGYAYFKIGNYKQAIKFYKVLENQGNDFDKVSQYNLLLAQGVELADSEGKFDLAIEKFGSAKNVLSKVEPWIYHAIVLIQKKNSVLKRKKPTNNNEQLNQEQLKIVISKALQILEQGFQVNSSSSNLLYHRTILHLFFPNLSESFADINLCIEKAEQNLPKYFYLRGLCYACQKDIKKAINQFSISISLNKQYSIAFLQRAKSYFLCGQTEMGFHDLKIYIDQCPQDLNVHKWIGDLLFQGTSYHDSIKAYNQMGQKITLDALCMRFKAELRIGQLKKIQQTMTEIKNHSEFVEKKFKIDLIAFNLLILINSGSGNKNQSQIQKNLQKLNELLEEDNIEKGQLFHLVDCMNLIGISNFYLQRFTQAYESFVIISEFFQQSFTSRTNPKDFSQNQTIPQQDIKKNHEYQKFNIEFEEDSYNLREEDSYYNAFVCLLARKQNKDVIKQLISQKLLTIISNKIQLKVIKKIFHLLEGDNNVNKRSNNRQNNQSQQNFFSFLSTKNKSSDKVTKKQKNTIILQPRIEHSISRNLRKFQFDLGSYLTQINDISIKAQLIWLPYQFTHDNLSFETTARNLIYQLHAGYIDNMPQGPWIKRNQYGVIFTDEILENQGNQQSFVLTTNRVDDKDQYYESEQQGKDNIIRQGGRKYRKYQQNYEIYQEETIKNELDDFQYNKNDKDLRKLTFLKQMKLNLKIQSKLNKIIKQKGNQ